MIAKILMCPCYVESFHEEGNSYVKELHHFCYKCKDDHEYSVDTCKYHPFQLSTINIQLSSINRVAVAKTWGPLTFVIFAHK